MAEKKILLIDDEVDFTEVVATLLGFHDFEVKAVNDPLQVDALLEQADFDLIVTDLMMPGLSGFDLIDKIRSKPKLLKIPIIVLSAKVLTNEERKFLLRQKVQVMNKPFEPTGLVDQICGLIETPAGG